MRFLLKLIKINLKLSFAEVKAIFPQAIHINDFAIVDSKGFDRLAFIREAFEILFESDIKNLSNKINSFEWNSPFAIRVKGNFISVISKKKLADLIWKAQKNPQVNLNNPKFDYHFFNFDDKVFATRKIYSNKEDFQSRRSHLRTESSPISLHPRLARAMVNLTGIKSGELLDPCVGTGGILLEAELINKKTNKKIKTIGIDISPQMLEKAQKNLNKTILLEGNALELKGNFDYIVSDLPYGRNTAIEDVEGFVNDFLKMINRVLRIRAVISFPVGIDVKFPSGLKVISDFSYYIHKSLSKRIIVLEKNN